MSEILLSGLSGDHPLGALAAFGLLRTCGDMPGFAGAKLAWRQSPGWVAVLHLSEPATPESLVASLADRQKRRAGTPELAWHSESRLSASEYADGFRQGREVLRDGKRELADYLAAFASDLSIDDNGRLMPTQFAMTSGQQCFFTKVKELAVALANGIAIGRRRKKTEDLFGEAMFGPWLYEDPQHSLGLDPTTERLHALRARSPTKEESKGVAAAVWMALEALPLFPCFLSRGRAGTTGFHRFEDGTALTWPLWTCPLSVDVVRSLLAMPELSMESPPRKELQARGIAAVYRSERYRVKTQGAYYILRAASPCT